MKRELCVKAAVPYFVPSESRRIDATRVSRAERCLAWIKFFSGKRDSLVDLLRIDDFDIRAVLRDYHRDGFVHKLVGAQRVGTSALRQQIASHQEPARTTRCYDHVFLCLLIDVSCADIRDDDYRDEDNEGCTFVPYGYVARLLGKNVAFL